MEPKKDYYEVLGVDHDADAKTIKRAFLKLARKLHPDVSDAPDAEERAEAEIEAERELEAKWAAEDAAEGVATPEEDK